MGVPGRGHRRRNCKYLRSAGAQGLGGLGRDEARQVGRAGPRRPSWALLGSSDFTLKAHSAMYTVSS